MSELLERIGQYWDKRAASYSEGLFAEDIVKCWEGVLRSQLPEGTRKVLDIGTGPGFFAVLLTKMGYEVTAVDYTPGMLNKARENAKLHLPEEKAGSIAFFRMDAQDPDFPDDTFDAAVTRNLTWNLEDPQKAYAEWRRVLKKGGVLLNFDAPWYEYLFDEEKAREYAQDRKNTIDAGLVDGSMSYPDSPVMEEISKELILSRSHRPEADLAMLRAAGFKKIMVDEEIWEEVWDDDEKIMYASTPMFLLKAIK